MHAEHAIGRFSNAGFTRACRVMAAVMPFHFQPLIGVPMMTKSEQPQYDAKILQQELDRLRLLAATSLDACTVAKYIALSDERVRDLLLQKQSYVFRGIQCRNRIGIPELIDVVFEFDCPIGQFCIVDPSFAAVVNLAHRNVVAIVDPYLRPSYSDRVVPSATFGERTLLVFSNLTFRDIHVQASKDVHTGNWGPFQINHNSERDAESKRIDFGERATFGIKVWNNNAGQPGDFIGEFEHRVRYNAAGSSDRLEFAIVDINGVSHLQAFSVRAAARIALLIWIGA